MTRMTERTAEEERAAVVHCATCRFFGQRATGRVTTPNLCRRFPREEQKHPLDWCGEWSSMIDAALGLTFLAETWSDDDPRDILMKEKSNG